MRFHLRTLLIVLTLAPPLLALAARDSTGALPAMLWMATFMLAPLIFHPQSKVI